jgi:glycosyltransferase involved in cell wall biosynthesis
MKILHVVNVSFVIPYFLGNQINYFKNKGHDIYIVCSNSNDLISFSKTYNFKYKTIEITRHINLISDAKSFFELSKFISEEKFDVVVGHTPKAALLAMLASFFNYIPQRIYFRHGLMFETAKGIKKNTFKLIEKITSFFSTKVICVSNSILQKSIKLNLSSKNKTILLRKGSCNGIDYETSFNPELLNEDILYSYKSKYNFNKEDIVIGFIGRIVQDKGIVELLEAWEILKNKHLNLKLLLIGPIEKRDGIDNSLLNKISTDNRIVFTGMIYDINIHYKLMNIFILPSYREGFPTVVLEASSMELPVITTKKTGCIDSIINNITGIFCDLNPESIVECVEKYILNKNMAITHGKNGRQFVINNFNQTIIWDSLINLYSNVYTKNVRK